MKNLEGKTVLWAYLVMEQGCCSVLATQYEEWINKNPDLFRSFVEHAREVRGFQRKYSGWVIVNKLRWDHDVSTTGDTFKIRNDYIALLTRHAAFEHPEFEGFFTQRELTR